LRSAAGCVIVAGVSALPAWTLLAASLVIGVAALVRMAGPAPAEPDDLAGIIRLSRPMVSTIGTLLALAALVFLVGVARRLRAIRRRKGEAVLGPEPARVPTWLRTLNQFLSFAYFVALAYLIWKGAIPLVGLLSQSLGIGSGIAPGFPEGAPLGAPPLVTWTFGALAITAAVGALALALWLAFADRLAEWWGGESDDPPLAPLAEVVDESLDDLRTEPDARRAIIRCYARFERVAARSGFGRKPWLTPMEFMREVLPRLPIPHGTLPMLTGLFEVARFSPHPLGVVERDRALDALDAIRAAIEAQRRDVAAA
jgi:hypothetical protein